MNKRDKAIGVFVGFIGVLIALFPTTIVPIHITGGVLIGIGITINCIEVASEKS